MHLWPSVRIRDSFEIGYLRKLERNLHRMKSEKQSSSSPRTHATNKNSYMTKKFLTRNLLLPTPLQVLFWSVERFSWSFLAITLASAMERRTQNGDEHAQNSVASSQMQGHRRILHQHSCHLYSPAGSSLARIPTRTEAPPLLVALLYLHVTSLPFSASICVKQSSQQLYQTYLLLHTRLSNFHGENLAFLSYASQFWL